MDKRKIFNKSYKRFVAISAPRFGEKGSVPIDQSLSKKFNIDPATGRPMSDVQRLVKMQNDVQMQAAFAQLNEFKSDFLPSDVSNEDALKFMCPRLSQLPSELLDYREGLNRYQLNQQRVEQEKAAHQKVVAEQQELFERFLESTKSKEDKS